MTVMRVAWACLSFVGLVGGQSDLYASDLESWTYRAKSGSTDRVLVLDASNSRILIHDVGVDASFCEPYSQYFCFKSRQAISFAMPRRTQFYAGQKWKHSGAVYRYVGMQTLTFQDTTVRAAVVSSVQKDRMLVWYTLTPQKGLIGIRVRKDGREMQYWLEANSDSGYLARELGAFPFH